MKNLKINFLIFFSTIFFSYIFLLLYTYYDFDNQFQEKFNSLENYKIHKKYSNIINHIRDEEHFKSYFKKPLKEDLVYTRLNENIKNSAISILLQGDSWIEQINGKDENFFSYKLFQKFGKEFNVEFLNAGTSSYSPSLMKIQLNLLKNDFNINPEIIVAFIDQVNFGDEVCRYKHNKIFKNGELIKVKQESYFEGTGWYNYSEKYRLSEIYYSKKNNLSKTVDLVNYKFFSRFNKIILNIRIKIINFFNKEKKIVKKCYWNEIEKYLMNPSLEDINYFRNTITNYIETAITFNITKKVILVSFPLKGHFLGKYRFNVSNLINDIIFSNKKFNSIQHLDFSKVIDNNISLFDIEKAWLEDGIHLNADYHGNLFVKSILNEIMKSIDDIKKIN